MRNEINNQYFVNKYNTGSYAIEYIKGLDVGNIEEITNKNKILIPNIYTKTKFKSYKIIKESLRRDKKESRNLTNKKQYNTLGNNLNIRDNYEYVDDNICTRNILCNRGSNSSATSNKITMLD